MAIGLELPTAPCGTFNAVRWFAKHFVHLECRVTLPDGKVQPWGFSGSIVEEGPEWFIVTAGHCLEQIKEYQSKGCTFSNWQLDDAAGINARFDRMGPFLLDGSLKGHLYDEASGIDYATIHLRDMYKRQLQSNGIEPLGHDAWPKYHRAFDSFWLLGVPVATLYVGTSPAQTWKGAHLMELDALTPSDVPSNLARATFGRHYFKIISGMDDVEPSVTSIVGMSGGPIFGVRTIDRVRRYWWIGIQSTWDPDTRSVSASPVDGRLRRVLKKWLRMFPAAE